MTSELNTKNKPDGLSLIINSFANLSGPAVPRGSFSIEIVILILYYAEIVS